MSDDLSTDRGPWIMIIALAGFVVAIGLVIGVMALQTHNRHEAFKAATVASNGGFTELVLEGTTVKVDTADRRGTYRAPADKYQQVLDKVGKVVDLYDHVEYTAEDGSVQVEFTYFE
jgi:hypothetical protein